tara:strand:+ start:1247 stop:2005 length:759 start_codon:yes stop_codon:yes gene_type:complete
MNKIKDLISNPYKNGINTIQFYFGLLLLLTLPILGKIVPLIEGEIITVTAIGKVSHERYSSSIFYNVANKYTLWEAQLQDGRKIQFEGSRNSIYEKGETQTALFNFNNIGNSFIISISGFYNNSDSTISLILIVLWISTFFVYGQSDKAYIRVKQITEWYLKILAVFAIVFLFIFPIGIPIWLYLTVGGGAVFAYAFVLLIISPQLKASFEYLFYTDEYTKKRAIEKHKKKRAEAQEIHTEIARRKKLKSKV